MKILSMLFAALTFALVAGTSSNARASEIHLLAHTLSWDGSAASHPGAPTGWRTLDPDLDGGGSDAQGSPVGQAMLEYGASIGTEFVVGLATLGFGVQTVLANDEETSFDLAVGVLVGAYFLMPALTSLMVTAIARSSGLDASYGKVLVTSLLVRVAACGFLFVAPELTLLSLLVAPAVEVWVAGTGPWFQHSPRSAGVASAAPPVSDTTARTSSALPGTRSAELLSLRF